MDNLDVDGVSSDVSDKLLTGLIKDTERYRVEKMLSVCAGAEDKVKKKCIEYLLKSWDELTAEQCIEVINQANRLIFATGVDDDVKVGVAGMLKNFIAKTQQKKIGEPVSFEKARRDGGIIDIDDD